MAGGRSYQVTGARDHIEKFFEVPHAHRTAKILFSFLRGDSWDGEAARVWVDGELVRPASIRAKAQRRCGER